MSSITGSSGAGPSRGIQTSQFYGPDRTLSKYQKFLQDRLAPQLAERAGQGLSSQERSELFTNLAGGLNMDAQAGQRNVLGALGKAGISGGLAGRALGGIEQSRMRGLGNIRSQISNLNLNQRQQNLQNALGLATSNAPIATGQSGAQTAKGTQNIWRQFGL